MEKKIDDGDAKTYRKDLFYINTIKGEYRREKVVSFLRFYLTWGLWCIYKPHFRKFNGFNVLYQEDCPPNEF